MRKTGIK